MSEQLELLKRGAGPLTFQSLFRQRMYVKPRLLALDGMASLERLLRKVQDPLVVRHPRVVVVRVRPPDLGQVAQADDVLRPSVEESRLVQDRADKPWRTRSGQCPICLLLLD